MFTIHSSLVRKLMFLMLILPISGTAFANCTLSDTKASTAPDYRYQSNSDGTVTDLHTGLMWQLCSLGQSGDRCNMVGSIEFSWDNALQQPENLNNSGGFAGHIDWRLPNRNELASLIEEACISGAEVNANTSVFPNTFTTAYWSSSPYAHPASPAAAWFVDFGESRSNTMSREAQNHVRLVRGPLSDSAITHELRLTVVNSVSSAGSIGAINSDTNVALADCTTDCSQQLISGQTVQLTPVAGDASEFSHWSGDAVCSENESVAGVSSVLVGTDTLCIAHFIAATSADITLTLNKTTGNTSLDGTMSAVPAFTDLQAIVSCEVGCTSATSEPQDSGAQFDIFASPQDNFASVAVWAGDPQCAANASVDKTSTRVTLTEATTCTVTFSAPL